MAILGQIECRSKAQDLNWCGHLLSNPAVFLGWDWRGKRSAEKTFSLTLESNWHYCRNTTTTTISSLQWYYNTTHDGMILLLLSHSSNTNIVAWYSDTPTIVMETKAMKYSNSMPWYIGRHNVLWQHVTILGLPPLNKIAHSVRPAVT